MGEIHFYPGKNDPEISSAVDRANALYWSKINDSNPIDPPLSYPEVCKKADFNYDANPDYAEAIFDEAIQQVPEGSREEGYIKQNLGIIHRLKGNYELGLDYLTQAQEIGIQYKDLNLVAESLANKVDLYISLANNPPPQEHQDIHDLKAYKEYCREQALVNAVEAFTLVRNLNRGDQRWFGWKVFEAANETLYHKYIADYVSAILLEKPLKSALKDTFLYGAKRVVEKIK